MYPSPALQCESSSYGWEGRHSRGSANLPHALHVAQPLKYCFLWREARSQSLQQFTPLFLSSAPAPPLCFLRLCTSFSLPLFYTHTDTRTLKKSLLRTCVLPTGSPLSVWLPTPFILLLELCCFEGPDIVRCSVNLHHSKDVSTMWTDTSNYGQMSRRITIRRMCDGDPFFSLTELKNNVHVQILQYGYFIGQ